MLKLISKLSDWQLYAIAGGLSLALIGGSFAAGYLIGGRNEARIQIKEVEKRIYVPTKEIQEVQVRNVERERELQASLAQSQQVVTKLQARLNAVPDNPCVVDSGAVGVLNEAITNGSAANPPGVPAGSTTTVTDLTDWSLTAIAQYNDVSTRYNALIDWVEDELIKPQTATSR